MWVNKTPGEIVADNSKKPTNCGKWMVYALVGFFLLLPVVFNIGRLSYRPGPFVRSYHQIMDVLPGVLILYILAIIMLQFVGWPKLQKKRVFICPKCEAAKNDDGNYSCSCGGHFVDIKTMKWVEAEPLSQS